MNYHASIFQRLVYLLKYLFSLSSDIKVGELINMNLLIHKIENDEKRTGKMITTGEGFILGRSRVHRPVSKAN